MNYTFLTLILLLISSGVWLTNREAPPADREPLPDAQTEVMPVETVEIAPSELDGVARNITSADLPGGAPVERNESAAWEQGGKTGKTDPFLPVIEEEIRVLQAKIDAARALDSGAGGRKISGHRVTIQRYEKKMEELQIRRQNILSPRQ